MTRCTQPVPCTGTFFLVGSALLLLGLEWTLHPTDQATGTRCTQCFLYAAAATTTSCPGDCNGNGACDASTTHCTCYSQYTGHDCSLRKCPFGPRWLGMVTATDTLHTNTAECSAAGDCDRATGKCKCASPYVGTACERLGCPPTGGTPCSGNGRCISLGQAASRVDDVDFFSTNTYALWDHDRVYGCDCDRGYTGYGCSLRKCPLGDDPQNGANTPEIQTFTCSGTSGAFNAKIYDELTVSVAFDATPATLESALEALPSIRGVAVTASAGTSGPLCGSGGNSFTVTFTHVPGDVPQIAFPTNTASAAFSSVSQTAATTSEECSGRGVCTRTGADAGLCVCETSFSSSDGSGSNTAGGAGDCAQYTSNSRCPGNYLTGKDCSGHGVCTTSSPAYRCTCDELWTGYDCSLRKCPYGRAWFDEPSATDTAHDLAECSNRGICGRTTGLCACDTGYSGAACERTVCPQVNALDTTVECNGRGRCMNIRTLNTFRKDNGVPAPLVYGSVPGSIETSDADYLMACLCDGDKYNFNQYEWTGVDCSFRTCPRGDDRETATTASGGHLDEVQQVTCDATGGTFTLGFRGETTAAIAFDAQATGTNATMAYTGTVTFGSATLATTGDLQAFFAVGDSVIIENLAQTESRVYTIAGEASNSLTMSEPIGMTSAALYNIYQVVTSVESALEALDTIRDVTVSFPSGETAACKSGGVAMSITFLQEHGDVPNLVLTESLSGGGDTLTLVNSVVGTKEDIECSLHGSCDQTHGVCECDAGWTSSDGRGLYGTKGDCGALISSASCTSSFCTSAGVRV